LGRGHKKQDRFCTGLKPVQFRPVNCGSAALERAHHARRSSRRELYSDRRDASRDRHSSEGLGNYERILRRSQTLSRKRRSPEANNARIDFPKLWHCQLDSIESRHRAVARSPMPHGLSPQSITTLRSRDRGPFEVGPIPSGLFFAMIGQKTGRFRNWTSGNRGECSRPMAILLCPTWCLLCGKLPPVGRTAQVLAAPTGRQYDQPLKRVRQGAR
jgi:hypothetical protein